MRNLHSRNPYPVSACLSALLIAPVAQELAEGAALLHALWEPVAHTADVLWFPLCLLFAIPLVAWRMAITADGCLDLVLTTLARVEQRARARSARTGRMGQGTEIVPAAGPRGRADEVCACPLQTG